MNSYICTNNSGGSSQDTVGLLCGALCTITAVGTAFPSDALSTKEEEDGDEERMIEDEEEDGHAEEEEEEETTESRGERKGRAEDTGEIWLLCPATNSARDDTTVSLEDDEEEAEEDAAAEAEEEAEEEEEEEEVAFPAMRCAGRTVGKRDGGG